jgi:NAD(P)-dependent dehydrogenase (short-subunit alcohol dehydrogenase family)
MERLKDKVAVITGGNSGMGLATTQSFVAEGAYVFITGRRLSELDAAVKQIGGNNISSVQGDVSNMADLDRLYAVVGEQKGRIDILLPSCGLCSLNKKSYSLKMLYLFCEFKKTEHLQNILDMLYIFIFQAYR